MPVTQLTKNACRVAFADRDAAVDFLTVVDAGSGTLAAKTVRLLDVLVADGSIAREIKTKVEAGDALTARAWAALRVALGVQAVTDIDAVLSA